MSASPVSDFTRAVLVRKTVGQTASVAVLWGTLNFVTLAIILGDMHIGGISYSHSLAWWSAVVACIVCIINIIVHFKSYVAPSFFHAQLQVNDKQKKLMDISENDTCFKGSAPKAQNSTPTSIKQISFSALFDSTLRTPQATLHQAVPATPTISATPMNHSAGSWAPTPCSSPVAYGATPFNISAGSWAPTPAVNIGTPVQWGNTPMNQSAGSWAPTPVKINESWGSGIMSASMSPLNFSVASSMGSPCGIDSSIGSIQATSWNYHHNQSSIMDSSFGFMLGSPQNVPSNPPSVKSPPPKPFPGISRIVKINTKDELDNYLHEYQQHEKRRVSLSQTEMNTSVNGSLWMYGGPAPHQGDFAHMLRKNAYQVATKDVGEETSSSDSKSEDVKASNLSISSVNKIWTKRNVTPMQLFQFEENLRIWMSSNILVPLVKAINQTNEALAAVAPELQIGSVGVDKLRKAAQNITGVKQLNNLLPFLDLTLHQDYLVNRLNQLSQGGAISAYKWNGGSAFNGKKWWDEYPTDTLILLHLFSMYMDVQLPPDPTQPEGRVFSSSYLVKTPEKPPKPANHCILYLTQLSPPHLKVVIQDEECEVGGGVKNLMHCLLLFCHDVTHEQHSRIAGVNLTLTGINLAWVVDVK